MSGLESQIDETQAKRLHGAWKRQGIQQVDLFPGMLVYSALTLDDARQAVQAAKPVPPHPNCRSTLRFGSPQ